MDYKQFKPPRCRIARDEKRMSNEAMQITPKGVVFLSLGGYTAEEEGKESMKLSDNVIHALTNYMKRSNSAIVLEDGRLTFVKQVEAHTEN